MSAGDCTTYTCTCSWDILYITFTPALLCRDASPHHCILLDSWLNYHVPDLSLAVTQHLQLLVLTTDTAIVMTVHISASVCVGILPNSSLNSIKYVLLLLLIPFFQPTLLFYFLSMTRVLNYHPMPVCIWLYIFVCVCACEMCVCLYTNVPAICLASSSLLQAAAEPSQRWRCGSRPALVRLHPGVHLSARIFPIRRFGAPCLPLWQQLDWQGACLQRYVVSKGLRRHTNGGGGGVRVEFQGEVCARAQRVYDRVNT